MHAIGYSSSPHNVGSTDEEGDGGSHPCAGVAVEDNQYL